MSITSVSSRTELEALNTMLQAINQRPVDDYSTNTTLDAINARTTLEEVYRRTLIRGWKWNTDYEYELTPDGSNNILVPSGALTLYDFQTGYGYYQDIVVIGDKLYDRNNQSYNFAGKVTCSIVWSRSWDELPSEAREFIAYRSARVFVKSVLNDAGVVQELAEEEARSFRELERHETETGRVNLIHSTEHYFRRRNQI